MLSRFLNPEPKDLILAASSAIVTGSFSAAEAKGAPCSGEAKMSERVVGARFLEVDDDRHLGVVEGLVEEFKDI
jgi:hypothetical protein